MKRTWILSGLIVLTLSGCAYYRTPIVSSTSIGTKNETPVRSATGISRAFYILGFGPFGDNSLNTAIENAKSKAPCDSISNVYVDRRITFFPLPIFPLVTTLDTMISGTLVRYHNADGTPINTLTSTGRNKPLADYARDEVWNSTSTVVAEEGVSEPSMPLLTGISKGFTFDGVKRGDRFWIIFKTGPKGKKIRKDGTYEFLWTEYGPRRAGVCAVMRPIGGGFFSKKTSCLEDIDALQAF